MIFQVEQNLTVGFNVICISTPLVPSLALKDLPKTLYLNCLAVLCRGRGSISYRTD